MHARSPYDPRIKKVLEVKRKHQAVEEEERKEELERRVLEAEKAGKPPPAAGGAGGDLEARGLLDGEDDDDRIF